MFNYTGFFIFLLLIFPGLYFISDGVLGLGEIKNEDKSVPYEKRYTTGVRIRNVIVGIIYIAIVILYWCNP